MNEQADDQAVVYGEQGNVLFRGRIRAQADGTARYTMMIGGRRFRRHPRPSADEAWPWRPMKMFGPRQGESGTQWQVRLEAEHKKAILTLQSHEDRLGIIASNADDHAFPDIGDDDYWVATDAVATIEGELIAAILTSRKP
jgi:hypothetical protein